MSQMKNARKDFSLEGENKLQDDNPIGPLEVARENLEVFADNLIMQQSLREMIDWTLTLEAVLLDPELSELETTQTKEELEMIKQAWSLLADTFYEKGISA
tara:strand:- start:963 stop:1265 length:303 start_codon:yes stop_codon:yes gene_type:complete